jgi:putative ABC transport system permease protein
MRRFDFLPDVRRLFRLPLRTPTAIHADIDEELESFLAARVDDLMARGMSCDDARIEAVRHLGASIDHVRDQLHHSADLRERRMQFHEQLEDLAQDIRYAARGLARRPAFTAVAVLTLAIGIGATTAIFSAVNVLLLRPLPVAQPGALMRVSLSTPAVGQRKSISDMVWSYPKATSFRASQQVFSSVALYSWTQVTITSGDVELIRGETVSASYFRTLGLAPSRGRDFALGVDAHAGAAPQVILSDALWQRRYNADPDIVGKIIDLDRKPYTIIGVAPPGFTGLTGQGQLFTPITARSAADLSEAQSHEFFMVARRATGVSESQAETAVTLLGKRINDLYPDQFTNNAPWGAAAHPLDAARVAPLIRRSLLVLFAAVGFVLLIACVNVANLLLGRASARRREIAVRLAIGAGRSRLVRLLLTESVLLSLIGAAGSVVVAWVGIHLLSGVNPATLPVQRGAGLGAVMFSSITLDWTALAFTLGLALLVGIFFGLAPALHATRASLADAMKEGGSGADNARGSHASAGRRVLVVAEVALALVLLAGSGLMIRSLTKLLAVDPGFDARNLLTTRLTIPPGGLARDSLPGFYSQLTERLGALPGVTNVGLASCAPLNGGCNQTLIEFKDRPTVEPARQPLVGVHWVTAEFFAAARVPLKRGRLFTAADRVGAPKVLLINETAARTFWPNEDPIGKRVGIGQGGFSDGAEVIGIVGDIRQVQDSAAKPDSYISYYQSPRAGMMIFIRTARNPSALGSDVRRALHDLAPQYPVYDMQPMTERAASATAQARFSAVLLGLFAATALSLAVVGIYGVMSLAVTARTREIGIRIALGADQRRVQRLVVGEGLALVSVGAAIGLAGALLSTRVLQSLLFDLTASDPFTYVSILMLLGVAALVASWLPARRAARVDPVVALRAD